MKAIHKQSENYEKREYWENRFESETEFDWLGKLENFKHLLNLKVKSKTVVLLTLRYIYIQENSLILILGCGNSSLSFELSQLGHFVVSCDYSRLVCLKEKEKTKMEYLVADCQSSLFRNKGFDCVIEKGVIDALIAGDNPWSLTGTNSIYGTNGVKVVSHYFR
jgi:SAM-dependent methyltransferase